MYDKEHGVYRVVEEYMAKPKAERARVEVCVQISDREYCAQIAKLEEANKPIKSSNSVKIKEKLLIFDFVNRESCRNMIERIVDKPKSKTIVAGYKPWHLTARVVPEIPGKQEIDRKRSTPLDLG